MTTTRKLTLLERQEFLNELLWLHSADPKVKKSMRDVPKYISYSIYHRIMAFGFTKEESITAHLTHFVMRDQVRAVIDNRSLISNDLA